MIRITLSKAKEILKADETARRDIYFIIGNKRSKYDTTQVEIDGVLKRAVRINKSEISDNSVVSELGAMSLYGGIYV